MDDNLVDIEKIGKIQSYWNERAALGYIAGSQDKYAKQLEIEAIASYISDGMRILDFGCGNGITAIEIARRYNVQIVGIDYAEKMIIAAKENLNKYGNLKGKIDFLTGDHNTLYSIGAKFDLIYTERTIINLLDWKEQKSAILRIFSLLKTNGKYIMCENSQDGLNKINHFRKCANLNEIIPPWHNRYLVDEEVNKIKFPGIELETINPFSSTYYFISRIINAWMADQEGKEPDYDATINKLGMELPPYGDMAQTKIWVWKKTMD